MQAMPLRLTSPISRLDHVEAVLSYGFTSKLGFIIYIEVSPQAFRNVNLSHAYLASYMTPYQSLHCAQRLVLLFY